MRLRAFVKALSVLVSFTITQAEEDRFFNICLYERVELVYFLKCVNDNGSEEVLKLWNSHKSFFGQMEEADVIALMCKSAVDAAIASSILTVRVLEKTAGFSIGRATVVLSGGVYDAPSPVVLCSFAFLTGDGVGLSADAAPWRASSCVSPIGMTPREEMFFFYFESGRLAHSTGLLGFQPGGSGEAPLCLQRDARTKLRSCRL
ncbi:uncharacterized protein ISCGN_011183 [Ixodes scapularis]